MLRAGGGVGFNRMDIYGFTFLNSDSTNIYLWQPLLQTPSVPMARQIISRGDCSRANGSKGAGREACSDGFREMSFAISVWEVPTKRNLTAAR